MRPERVSARVDASHGVCVCVCEEDAGRRHPAARRARAYSLPISTAIWTRLSVEVKRLFKKQGDQVIFEKTKEEEIAAAG